MVFVYIFECCHDIRFATSFNKSAVNIPLRRYENNKYSLKCTGKFAAVQDVKSYRGVKV
jgi:hypothetical protein